MEKLWRALWHSCDCVGDGHCATTHCVENVGRKGYRQRITHAHASIHLLGGTRDSMCVTKHISYVLDLVHILHWGVT
jgi:hypothetical protein